MSKDMVEQIADCLLQNHMELMAEVKHLRDELERLLVRIEGRGVTMEDFYANGEKLFNKISKGGIQPCT